MERRYFARIAVAALAPSLAAALFAGASPALAQEGSVEVNGETVNQLIVYGDDPCPASTGNEITVCARKQESERYRIPEILRESKSPANESWSQKVQAYETVGASGIMSCSPSGVFGATGCTQKLIDAAYAEKHGSSDIRFSELIQEERAKRLSTIDADAAAEQARVEKLEKAYDAKLDAEREAPLPDEQAPAADQGEQKAP